MNNFSIYDIHERMTPFVFQEVFESLEDFTSKVVAVGGDSDIDELYYILANKYMTSTTRYYAEESFIMAIRRNLATAWPSYKRQKAIQDEVFNLSSADIMTRIEIIKNGLKDSEYKSQKDLSENVTDASESSQDLKNTGDTLTNIVDANTTPVVDADTIAIKNKSNKQQNIHVDTGTTQETIAQVSKERAQQDLIDATNKDILTENIKELGNKLEALNKQYESVSRDYLIQIYRKVDHLFRVIL